MIDRRRHLPLAGAILALLVTLAVGCGSKPEPPAGTPAAPAAAAKELDVFIWSAYLPDSTVAAFEQRTGAKVRVDLYDSNEALLAKLQSGVARYDLVVPSDYMVKILVAEGLIQPLDKTRLTNLGNLDPRLLGRPYDPENQHTVPYVWGTTGYAYDKAKIAETLDSWGALFDPRFKGRILMLDDMREGFAAALKLDGRSLNERDPAALARAAERLKAQKPLVRTYDSGDFANVLAAGDVDLAHGYSGQLAQVVRNEPQRLAYVVPKEGATLWIDNLAIPTGARHPDAAHAFIDYLLEPAVAAEITGAISYASANQAARPLIAPEILADPAVYAPDEVLARCELIEDLGETTELLDQYWTEIKAE